MTCVLVSKMWLSLTVFAVVILCFNCEETKSEIDNPNQWDIWNQSEWKEKNQKGIAPGEIRFCITSWFPFTVSKGKPFVSAF